MSRSGRPKWLKPTTTGLTPTRRRYLMVKATDDPTNTSVKTTASGGDLTGLAARLAEHADGIENLAAREMANDMASAARAIDRLVAGIRKAVDSTTDPGTPRHLRELLG